MADGPRNPEAPSGQDVPEGLLEELQTSQDIRVHEVARGRRHAADRAYEDGAVVEEIASQLLTLSAG